MARGLSTLFLLCGAMLVTMGLLGADGKQAGCVPVPVEVECTAPADCEGMAHDACDGAWTCTGDATCAWECATEPPLCAVGPICGGGGGAKPGLIALPDCAEGTTCSCVSSCQACDDCATAACAPPGVALWLCGDAPCGVGSTCTCIPSCPDCADCAAAVCVPDGPCGPVDCPLWAPPAPGWCDGGVVLDGGKDKNGCQLPPTCVKDCATAETTHATMIATGKACAADSQCTEVVSVGLLCPCPRVLASGADVAGIQALQAWYLTTCTPSEGWGCGGGCPGLPTNACTDGACSP